MFLMQSTSTVCSSSINQKIDQPNMVSLKEYARLAIGGQAQETPHRSFTLIFSMTSCQSSINCLHVHLNIL